MYVRTYHTYALDVLSFFLFHTNPGLALFEEIKCMKKLNNLDEQIRRDYVYPKGKLQDKG